MPREIFIPFGMYSRISPLVSSLVLAPIRNEHGEIHRKGPPVCDARVSV
jgi:hypothetical protein